jgi:hypothetical protein
MYVEARSPYMEACHTSYLYMFGSCEEVERADAPQAKYSLTECMKH